MTNPGGELRRKLDDLTQRQHVQQRQAVESARQNRRAAEAANRMAEQAEVRRTQQAQSDAGSLLVQLSVLGVDQKLLQIRDTIWGGEGELKTGVGIDQVRGVPLAYFALVFEYPDSKWVEVIPARTHYVSLEGGSTTEAPATGIWKIGRSQLSLMVIARQENDGFRWFRVDIKILQLPRKSFDPIEHISGDNLGGDGYGKPLRSDLYNLHSAQAGTQIDEQLVQYANMVLNQERGPVPVTGDYVSPWTAPRTLRAVGRTHVRDNVGRTITETIGVAVLVVAIAAGIFLCCGGSRLLGPH